MSASKQQASLLSFFKRTPTSGSADQSSQSPSRSPATSKPSATAFKTPTSSKKDNRVFKRINMDDVDEDATITAKTANIGSQAKRRRVVLSSDDEDENELMKMEVEEVTPSTPRQGRKNIELSTPVSSSKKRPGSSLGNSNSVATEFATSFINSFRADENAETTASAAVGTPSKSLKDWEKTLNSTCFEIDRFRHEDFEFLKPDKIRDASKRRPDDPEYDATTLLVPDKFINDQTPAHQQWWKIKSQNFDVLLFFKVGKFYELFHMDAVIAVNCLGLAYMRGDLAHAGFPEHAYPKFADQLIARGYKVARIEQTETPQMLEERNKKKKAGSKDKVVLRELCRITSTATRTFGPLDAADDGEAATQHLISIKEKELNGKPCYGVCYIDTSVGKFTVGQFEDDEYRSALRTLLATSDIAQILLERGNISQQTKSILTGMCCSVPIDHLVPKKQFFVAEDTVKMLQSLDYLGVDVPSWPETIRSMLRTDHVLPEPAVEFDLAWSSLGAIIGHLQRCQIDVDMVTMKDFEMFRPFNDDDKKKENVKASESTMKMKDNWWEGRRVVLDGMTLYNLNIVPSDRSDPIDAAASLYYTVNRCSTPFGKRLLRQWLCAPPCDKTEIELRQDAIEWLLQPENDAFVESTTEILRKIPDLERLLQKIHTLGLKYRAEKHPDSRAILFDTRKINSRKIKDLIMAIDSLKACSDVVRLYGKLEEGCTLMDKCLKGTDISELKEDISNFMKSFDRKQAQEDGFITPVKGSDELYDEAVLKEKAAHDVLDDYRKSVEKQLKCSVKFAGTGKNRLQLEIPTDMKLTNEFELKSRAKKMSKYTTPRLLKLIAELEVAEAEIVKQTNDATRRTFEAFDNKRSTWRIACDGIAIFDVLLSLAKYAKTSGLEMCRPQFDFNAEKPFVSICEGVHPCLANRPLPNANAVAFIPNDTQLGGGAAPILLLTGPNAGGKSTLMRQVATLGVLAHTGSLVPAQSMHLSPVDRIFTRIGASDKIMCGQSTFFVELNETKLILKNATANSLVLFDELGRGTSTFDGTAIASSVLTYLASHISCRGFFSTHYHSICNNIGNNLQIALGHMACIVENENEEDPTEESVTFLYKLTTGICPKSYGFHAAKLASISDEVIRVAYAAARDSISSFTRLEAVRSAARNGVSIDELSKMIAAI